VRVHSYCSVINRYALVAVVNLKSTSCLVSEITGYYHGTWTFIVLWNMIVPQRVQNMQLHCYYIKNQSLTLLHPQISCPKSNTCPNNMVYIHQKCPKNVIVCNLNKPLHYHSTCPKTWYYYGTYLRIMVSK